MAIYTIDTRTMPIDFEIRDDMERRTVQNARNLLRTRQGEIPYDRYRGFDVSLLDKPMSEVMTKLLPEVRRCLLWEPDAEALRAWIEQDGEQMIVCCTINVDI